MAEPAVGRKRGRISNPSPFLRGTRSGICTPGRAEDTEQNGELRIAPPSLQARPGGSWRHRGQTRSPGKRCQIPKFGTFSTGHASPLRILDVIVMTGRPWTRRPSERSAGHGCCVAIPNYCRRDGHSAHGRRRLHGARLEKCDRQTGPGGRAGRCAGSPCSADAVPHAAGPGGMRGAAREFGSTGPP